MVSCWHGNRMRPSLKALENVLVVQPMAVGNSLLYDQTYYYQRQCNYLTADTRMFLCASGIASCLFTSSGEGFFLKSSSEYARFSLSAARLLRPLCKLNLKDGLRTPEGTPQIVVEHYGNYPPLLAFAYLLLCACAVLIGRYMIL